jgi:hypothetical protein
MTPSYEPDNHMANFDPQSGQLVFAQDGSLDDRTLVGPDRNNFGPRIGVVYQMTEKTILRGGYGLFYNFLDRIGSEDQLALNPPGTSQQQHHRERQLEDAGARVARRLPRQLSGSSEHRLEPPPDPCG